MKFSTILLFAASCVLAAPVFWGHPNVQVGLAPELPLGQIIDLSLEDLISQNPQDQIWYTGGLVGYFSNEWEAPVWTTPWVDWGNEPEERGQPVVSPPYTPPVTPPRTLPDPPDPPRVIIHPVIHPPEPPPFHPPPDNPPPGTPPIDNPHHPPPPDHGPPDVNIDPPAVTDVPEPNLSGIVAIILATVVGAHIRAKRRR